VTVKQVPDPDIPPSHFTVDEATRQVVPPVGVAPVMNGYDAHALEAALQLREQHGDSLKRAIAWVPTPPSTSTTRV